MPGRRRISKKTTLTLTRCRPTGEGTARPISGSVQDGWICRPTDDDSPSPIRWGMCLARKGVLSSLTGLVSFSRDHPAINRWAIFWRPCGTLDSRCVLIRSKRWVAGERFPAEPRMTRVSRTNTDSKVPSGTTDNSQRFRPWVADARTTRAPQGRKKAACLPRLRPRGIPAGRSPERSSRRHHLFDCRRSNEGASTSHAKDAKGFKLKMRWFELS